jgi:hypothetical protein
MKKPVNGLRHTGIFRKEFNFLKIMEEIPHFGVIFSYMASLVFTSLPKISI